MKWKELIDNVEQWAADRGITQHSNPQAQLLKAVSEMGELCDAEISGSPRGQIDGVGDTIVCLIIYCVMKGYDMRECLEFAYDQIKDREGKISEGGAFVKHVSFD
jgi:hypothetical protein